MPVFKYEALDSQGVAIKNEIEALSQKEAVSKIRNMGYFPTKVHARGVARKTAAKVASRPKRRR
ncbi:MAG: type II secretion system F family protein, partial [Phycisphaerae bacterium]|nr:type II secretion system F family protein [Phycisphaerae bacterium]